MLSRITTAAVAATQIAFATAGFSGPTESQRPTPTDPPTTGLVGNLPDIRLVLQPGAAPPPPVTIGDIGENSKLTLTKAEAAKVKTSIVDPIVTWNKAIVEAAKLNPQAGAVPRAECVKNLEEYVVHMHDKLRKDVGLELTATNAVEKFREVQEALWKSGYILTGGIKTLGNGKDGMPVSRMVLRLMELDKDEPHRTVTIPEMGGFPAAKVVVGHVSRIVSNDPALGAPGTNLIHLGESAKPALGWGYAVRFKEVWHVDDADFERRKILTGKALETHRNNTSRSTFANEGGHARLYAEYPTLFGHRSAEFENKNLVKLGGQDFTVRHCNELYSNLASMACYPKDHPIGIDYSLTFADPAQVREYALCNLFVTDGVHAAAAARGWATRTRQDRLSVYEKLFTDAAFCEDANTRTYRAVEEFFRENAKPALDEMERNQRAR